jgi:hypothetical protein
MDDEPSKCWPCPECGSVEFRPASCVFERGGWVDDETWRADDPPNGHPTAIAMDVTCLNCGHEFDIARYYEWPIVGEFESTI